MQVERGGRGGRSCLHTVPFPCGTSDTPGVPKVIQSRLTSCQTLGEYLLTYDTGGAIVSDRRPTVHTVESPHGHERRQHRRADHESDHHDGSPGVREQASG
jgi:hypothetical protein